MYTLKTLPISYEGDLHNVKLINFTVDPDEIRSQVPEQLPLRLFDGKAMISMVNVELKNMKPTFMPSFAHFNYRHVGFRLLIDDRQFTGAESKGIFFLRSFTDRSGIAVAGKHLTNYRLEKGNIACTGLDFLMEKGDKYLRYRLKDQGDERQPNGLKDRIRKLDRAFAVDHTGVWMTRVLRISWPIEAVKCAEFETNFFESANYVGAFRIRDVIRYNWLSPRQIEASRREVESVDPVVQLY